MCQKCQNNKTIGTFVWGGRRVNNFWDLIKKVTIGVQFKKI